LIHPELCFGYFYIMGISFGGVKGAAEFRRLRAASLARKAKAKPKPKSRSTFRVASRPAARPSVGSKAKQRAGQAFGKKLRGVIGKASAEERAFQKEFRQFRKGLEPLDVLRKRLAGELGIPELRAQLEPLRGRSLELGRTLLDLPELVGELTRGQGEARRRLLETSKGADIEKQLRDVAISQEFFAGQLAGARGELTEQLGVTQEQRNFDLRAFGQEADILSSRLGREVAGYTTALQAEFEGIIADITDARQLARDQQQRAFELAKLERAAALSASSIGNQSKQADQAFKSQITGIKSRTPAGVGNVFPRFAASALLQGGNLQNIYAIWAKFSGFGPAKENPAVIIAAAKGQIPKGSGLEIDAAGNLLGTFGISQ